MSIPIKKYDESIGSDFLNHYASIYEKKFKQNDLIISWNMYVNITNNQLKTLHPHRDLSKNPKFVMVGDVHGSFLQLLTPLIQYGFIDNVRLHEITGSIKNVDIGSLFTFELYTITNTQKKLLPYLIYLGDIVDHSIHGMDLLLVRILMDLIQTFSYNIYWCFGNHDMALYYTMIGSTINIERTFKVSKYEINAYPKLIGYNSFRTTFLNFIKNSTYECNILIYYCMPGEISCSHTYSNKHIYHHLNDIVKRKKQNDKELLHQLFVNDWNSDKYKSKLPYYYGHNNKLSEIIRDNDEYVNIYDTKKVIDKLCEKIRNKKLYCCDLGASTFSMFVNKNLWGYEFITHVALHPGSRVPIRCPFDTIDYTSILEKLGIKKI